MRFKNNTRQRKKSIQGLRSFRDSLPKDIRETISKKAWVDSEPPVDTAALIAELQEKVKALET